MVITRRRVNTSIKSKIRAKLTEEITNQLKGKTLEDIINMVNNQTIQKSLIEPLSKIYPVRAIEFRRIDMLKKKARTRLENQETSSNKEGIETTDSKEEKEDNNKS